MEIATPSRSQKRIEDETAELSFSEQEAPTVVLVGEADDFAERLGTVLGKHHYKLKYCLHHDIAKKRVVPSKNTSATIFAAWAEYCAGGVSPVLYVLDARRWPSRSKRHRAQSWSSAVRELCAHSPEIPILVALPEQDPESGREAIDAGAAEILGQSESGLTEEIWVRVQLAIARSTLTRVPHSRLFHGSVANPDTDVMLSGASSELIDVERRIRARRKDDLTSAGRLSALPEAKVKETSAAPLSVSAQEAALERVKAKAASLPTRAQIRDTIVDILGVTAPQLRSDAGRLDAKKVAARLGIALSQLAGVSGVSRQALAQTPDSASIQSGLDPIARTLMVLEELLPEDSIRPWLQTRHVRLEGATPLEALLDGRGEKVANMLEIAREGGVD